MTGTTSPKLCFVIMPFKEERWEVFEYGIAPACAQAGFQAVRVDQLQGVFNITREIIEHLFRCEVIIAEVTDQNPNVFYEMGVAHTIDNKTVMIAQKAADLPFDIRNYRCIIYKQSVEGLQRLQRDLVASLQEIEKWRAKPSNPVQDFKPRDVFVLQSDFDKLQKTLQQKDELLAAAQTETAALQKQLREKDEWLKQAVPKSEFETLQKEAASRQAETAAAQKQLRERDANLEQAAKKAAALQNELAQKQAENSALQKQIQISRQPAAPKSAPPPPKKLLRSQPLAELSVEAAKKMLQEKNFFDSNYNKSGKGLQHQYEAGEQDGQKLVRDHATGLMWQQSGSSNAMNYADAEKYVRDLNAKIFSGFNDWRMPTLEEAMSLMEPKKHGDVYIDPVFDRKQTWIWTADKADSAGVAWAVLFSLVFASTTLLASTSSLSVRCAEDNLDHLVI